MRPVWLGRTPTTGRQRSDGPHALPLRAPLRLAFSWKGERVARHHLLFQHRTGQQGIMACTAEREPSGSPNATGNLSLPGCPKGRPQRYGKRIDTQVQGRQIVGWVNGYAGVPGEKPGPSV